MCVRYGKYMYHWSVVKYTLFYNLFLKHFQIKKNNDLKVLLNKQMPLGVDVFIIFSF